MRIVALTLLLATVVVSAASATEVTVVVAGAGGSDEGPVCVNSGAKVSIVPVEGRTYVGYTDSKGKVVITFPGSRSFIIEVTAGPGYYAATSRMYGEMDHTVSVYMGPSPMYANEDVLGIQGEAIRHVAADLDQGISKELQSSFAGPELDRMIEQAAASGGLSKEQADDYRAALRSIRNAKVKAVQVPQPSPPRRRLFGRS